MKLIALLAFYDEPAECLSECIASLATEGGVDKLVVVDGAYATFPDGKAASPVDQHAAVMVAARRHGLDLALHVPSRPWEGGEVEKRSFLFNAGLAVASQGDWFWVIDADEFVAHTPDLKQRLAATDHDVAAVTLHDTVIERIPPGQRSAGTQEDFLLRMLFRAQPIRVVTNHYTYVTGDGRVLWGGQGSRDEPEPALEMPELVVNHSPDRRPTHRIYQKNQYYTDRDNRGMELGDCVQCVKRRKAARKVPSDLRLVKVNDRTIPAGTWIEVCGYHARRQEDANRRTLKRLGFDPDSGSFKNRNGRIADLEAVAA